MRLFVIAAAAVALLGASAALADTQIPNGFSLSPRLGPAASFVAGKPVAVYCANTQYDWLQFLAETGRAGSEANGSTVPGSSSLSLSPTVCTNLRLKLAGKAVRDSALGPSILVLTHEAIHDSGDADEGQTDCDAVHRMPRVAVKFFRVKTGKQLRGLMGATWAYRSREPSVYRTVC